MSIENLKWLRKYNVPGPRYTSYPTVPYWEETPTIDQWIESLKRSLALNAEKNIGGALYVHIPFCQSLCTYCGCNNRITRNKQVANPYVDAVLKEWELYREKLAIGNEFPLAELHLGGGTPTFLEVPELKRLLEGIIGNSKPTQNHEFSIEVDPRVTTEEQLKLLADFGFKRISLGVQDFDPKVQEIVNRTQSPEQVLKITEAARKLGFTSVNFDLIYGLPFQTKKSVIDTVNLVNEMKPDRIAFYAYAHVPWIKPGQRKFTEADLPVGEEKRELYEIGRELFEQNEYLEIGMDHFALKTDSLYQSSQDGTLHRNFMGYTSRQVDPLIGLGVSSIGDSWTQFAQNEKLVETYQSRVMKGEIPLLRGHILNAEDQFIRRQILNLMTRFETNWDGCNSGFVSPFSSLQDKNGYFDSVTIRLNELIKDKIVELSGEQCKVSPKGKAVLRNVCMAFDARLHRKSPDTKLFSQSI